MEDMEGQNSGITESLRYHPSYPFRDDNLAGDLVLLSKDGVHFHVHSLILKLASSFFLDMLEIPRTRLESAGDPIPLEEKADIIAAILDIVYPSFHTREVKVKQAVELYAEDLTAAADKYDMPAIILLVKDVLFADTEGPGLLWNASKGKWSAIRKYDLACRYQWEEEAKLAAKWTLRRSLTTIDSLSELQRVSSRTILQLQKLHRDRIQAMIDSLESVFVESRKPIFGCSCGIANNPLQLRSNNAWLLFIYTMTNLLDKDPLATDLIWDVKWGTQGYAQIFEIKHDTGCISRDSILDKNRFISGVRSRLHNLPTSI